MEQVLLLNYDYTFLSTVSWKKALKLLNKNKVEVLKYSGIVIKTVGTLIKLPKVIKLIYFIQRVCKTRMSFSRRVIFARDNNECAYCGEANKKLTIDHIVPKSKGGKTVFENVVACCFTCNSLKKRDRTPDEAGMKLLKKPYAPTIIEYLLKTSKIKNSDIMDILSNI